MSSTPPGHDACAQLRQAMTVVCGRARDALATHESAVEHTRGLRRRLVTARRAVEGAQAAAGEDRRREEKSRLRETYLRERALAASDGERAGALGRWARGLDGVNRAARRAQRALATARRQATALEDSLRQAEQAEQAARVAAQSAEAACLEARVALAACEEHAVAEGVPGVTGGAPGVGGGAPRATGGPPARPLAGGAPVPPGGRAPTPPPPRGGRVPGAAPPVIEPSVAHTRIGQGDPTVMEALLSGDRRWLEVVAMTIAEHTGRPPARVLAQVRELIDAVAMVASQRGYVTIEGGHPFWSRLTDDEDRDVLAALVRMGFQVEPPLGWHGGRAPVPSDLSMALAYAGIEPRAMRNLPTAAELRELPLSVAVDAPALLAAEAPDLALDHIVPMLGERADSLGPLWEEWGQIRPVLLGDPRAFGARSA